MHVKNIFLSFLFCLLVVSMYSQYLYEPSPDHPYGLPNPDAPQELLDFAPLIGECQCKSVSRNVDQTWGDTIMMTWRYKYIMNGMAVQDETLKEDGQHSGSIRQYIADSNSWYVHYYSSAGPSTTLPVWEGNKNEDGDIILYREQKAPNGTDGFYKINFIDISTDGFNWLGEWVTPTESYSYPSWKIYCTKVSHQSNDQEKEKILGLVKKFSKDLIAADYEAIANAYTEDGKIFPNDALIIDGREAVREKWESGGGSIVAHEIIPSEIKFLRDYAYDYGYYKGQSKNKEGGVDSWKGKYVIVWRKTTEGWKMYLDIWNRVKE